MTAAAVCVYQTSPQQPYSVYPWLRVKPHWNKVCLLKQRHTPLFPVRGQGKHKLSFQPPDRLPRDKGKYQQPAHVAFSKGRDETSLTGMDVCPLRWRGLGDDSWAPVLWSSPASTLSQGNRARSAASHPSPLPSLTALTSLPPLTLVPFSSSTTKLWLTGSVSQFLFSSISFFPFSLLLSFFSFWSGLLIG